MTTTFLLLLLAGVVMAQPPAPALRVTMISLPVTDTARSVKFYAETLGLSLIGKPGEVTLFRAGEVTLALNLPVGRSAHSPVGAVEVIFPAESVAAWHQALAARGCKFLVGPHELTPGMWAATFVDPDGNRLTILGAQ